MTGIDAAELAPSHGARGGRRARELSRRGETRRERLIDAAAVLTPSALAGALSFYEIGARSIWLDESASISIASQHGAALGAAMAHDGGNMLVYYALLHVLIGLFGNGVVVVRAPSAVATVATVAIVCVVARRLFDRRVALASGLLSAVSLPLVYWGQDARAYAPMVALVSASFLAFVVLVESDGARTSRWAWVAYVAATTLALYMSFVAVLVVPAQLVALVWCRRRLRPVALALLVCALCSAPLVVLARQRGSGQLFWVPKPSAAALHQVLESLTSAAFQPNFPRTGTSDLLTWATVALLAGAVAIAAGRIVRRHGDPPELSEVLLLGWLVLPVLLAWAESSVGQSIFLPRNLLVSLPPVGILLASVTVGRTRVSGSSRPASWGWAVVALLLALRALQLAPTYGVSPENWKAAVSYVLTRTHPGDCIAFYPSDGRMAFEYYIGASAAGPAPRPVLPSAAWGDVRPYVENYTAPSRSQIAGLLSGCSRLWLVASHQGDPNGPAASVRNYRRYLILQAALATEMARHTTAAFGYAAPVDVELLSR
ncbi:MAG: glycosyl transferase, family 39 [Acidimicrobiaceae bacterium]|nr:glycosyl transferase, family 39 [Acidimicrobiaceae bacterium]